MAARYSIPSQMSYRSLLCKTSIEESWRRATGNSHLHDNPMNLRPASCGIICSSHDAFIELGAVLGDVYVLAPGRRNRATAADQYPGSSQMDVCMFPKSNLIETGSLGQCWLQVSRQIMQQGRHSRYDGAATKEMAHLTLVVNAPDLNDDLIRLYGDPAWLAWMHDNFFTQKEVVELGNAPSYAVRLFNYANRGLDQLQWVVERLRENPETRSATLTTFMPLTDTTYIPCISLLDFWLPDRELELVVYAHSLDFGKKAYGNLIELAVLQATVAGQLARPAGRLIIHVKSAHIYEPEWNDMRRLCESVGV